MKPHTLHRLYKAIMFVVLAGIVMVVYRTNPDFLKAPKAESSAALHNVSGFAWSGGAGTNPGIGWISFNDTSDTSAPPEYGVNINSAGNFSGTAWSENIGWISFDRSKTGNPPSPGPYDVGVLTDPIAMVDTGTGIVTGWARAIAGCEMTAGFPASDCTASGTGAGAAAGEWDGWIRLSGNATDVANSPYGLRIGADGSFSNDANAYAWGEHVVGWVDFSPEFLGVDNVHVNFPACTLANVTSWGSCTEQAGFCSSNPPGTLIPKIRIGMCGFGYSGTVSEFCFPNPAPLTYCPLPAASCGDSICSGSETLLSCPTDCKSKVQQF